MALTSEQQALVQKYTDPTQLVAIAKARLQQHATELVQWSWNAANAEATGNVEGLAQAQAAIDELTLTIQTQEQQLAALTVEDGQL